LNPFFTPFDDIDIEKTNDILNIKQIKSNTNTIVNNLDNIEYELVFTSRVPADYRQYIISALTEFDFVDISSGLNRPLIVNAEEKDAWYYNEKNLNDSISYYLLKTPNLYPRYIQYNRVQYKNIIFKEENFKPIILVDLVGNGSGGAAWVWTPENYKTTYNAPMILLSKDLFDLIMTISDVNIRKQAFSTILIHEYLHNLGLGHTWSEFPKGTLAINKIMYYHYIINTTALSMTKYTDDEKYGLYSIYSPPKFADKEKPLHFLKSEKGNCKVKAKLNPISYPVWASFYNTDDKEHKDAEIVHDKEKGTLLSTTEDVDLEFKEIDVSDFGKNAKIKLYAMGSEDCHFHKQTSSSTSGVPTFYKDNPSDSLEVNLYDFDLKLPKKDIYISKKDGVKTVSEYFLDGITTDSKFTIEASAYDKEVEFDLDKITNLGSIEYKIVENSNNTSKEEYTIKKENRLNDDDVFSVTLDLNNPLSDVDGKPVILDTQKSYILYADAVNIEDGKSEDDRIIKTSSKILINPIIFTTKKSELLDNINLLSFYTFSVINFFTNLYYELLDFEQFITFNCTISNNADGLVPDKAEFFIKNGDKPEEQITSYTKIDEKTYEIKVPRIDFISGLSSIRGRAYYKKVTDSKTDEYEIVERLSPFNFYRPITLSSSLMVFKKPDAGGKFVVGTIIPIEEKDTIRVTVPKYATEPEYWGGTEILLDGQVSDKITIPELPEPPFREYGDSIRVYKFVWDFAEQPEGFVTMRARYKLDPLSYSQRKVKVGYSTVWEDFEGVAQGELPPGWVKGADGAYPMNASFYFGVQYNSSTNSSELRTSSGGMISQRYEVLSPVITVPPASDDVETFLYFDYARELLNPAYFNAKSLMVIQICDEYGNKIEQPLGSISTTAPVYDINGNLMPNYHYPIDGYPLNLANFFSANIPGIALYPDNTWLKFIFWLNWGSSVGDNTYHDYSGQRITIKFIQYFNNDFLGVVDNWYQQSGTPYFAPSSFTFNPPDMTDPTCHHIDNFLVRTFYMINLPPTIDKVADQEVKQHCGWQKINLTGITNGENAILGDNEDLEDQSKSLLKGIKRIKDVEQREDGSLKITALVQEDSTFKEVSLPSGTKKSSKFLPQNVVSIILSCDNGSLIPSGNLRLESPYTTGSETAVLEYLPEDTKNGVANITVRVEDDGGTEHNGRNYTEMKFKVTVKPFNPPEYKNEITQLNNIMEDFSQIDINFDSHFIDPDPGTVDIYYKAYCDNPSMMSVTLDNSNLVIKSIENVNGTCNLTIVADDSTGTIPTVVTKTVIIADDGEDLCFSSGFASQELQLPV
ncbi:MAG: hypothetical protein KKD38_08930, partial [Candidatus Delongbacteria bacterium]|nr:hypothetical protein [Candidatus Delongbacteria bacterium]